MPPSTRELLDFATEAAIQAGALVLSHFQKDLRVETKADRSPVTAADRGAEQLLRTLIEARFPDHAILGEEMGATLRGSDHRWILDPIDGTRSFVRGVPLFGVLIGLEVAGEVTVGVAHFPALGETLAAARGLGCSWNGRSARVSETKDLGQALLVYGDAASLENRHPEAWRRLREASALQRGWGDCYGHCLVATGRAEVMLDPIASPWDIAALKPILEEAGGTLTDWEGRPRIDSGSAFSTNGLLFANVRKVLRGD